VLKQQKKRSSVRRNCAPDHQLHKFSQREGFLIEVSTQSASRDAFRQAGIGIGKLQEFEQLRSAIGRVFAATEVKSFFQVLQRKGVPIRDFDKVLREKLLEKADSQLKQSGSTAQALYDALTMSDKAQMREFYLTALETVDLPVREKFNKLYRYY
jgi:hypothetical protein